MDTPKDVLIKARKRMGLRQEDVAQRLGITLRMYQRYEEGRFPKYKSDNIKQIDSLLGIKIYELIYDGKSNTDTTNNVVQKSEYKIEGNVELEYLKQLLKAKEDILAEKEARRQETAARLKTEEDRVDGLLSNINSSLLGLFQQAGDLLKAHRVSAAHQSFWIERWALMEAKGDKDKAKVLSEAYRKEVIGKLTPTKDKSTH